MNKDLLIIIIVISILYLFYEINNIKKIEPFTTTPSSSTQQQINTAVKQIYLADVEAIRLLSNFAIQLSQGGFTIPGNAIFSADEKKQIMIGKGELKFRGDGFAHYSILNKNGVFSIENTSVNNAFDVSGTKIFEINKDNTTFFKTPVNFENHLYLNGSTGAVFDMGIGHINRVNNSTGKSGVIQYNGPNKSLQICGRGDLSGNKLVTVSDDLTITNNLNVNNNISLTKANGGQTIDFGAGDTTREGNAGKITYGNPNLDSSALSIIGKGNTVSNRQIRMWDDVTINKNLTVNNEINCNSGIKCNGIKIGSWILAENEAGLLTFTKNNQQIVLNYNLQ